MLLWEAPVAVTDDPDWFSVVDQLLVTCWSPGHVQFTSHEPEPPVLATSTLAVKPEPQSLATV